MNVMITGTVGMIQKSLRKLEATTSIPLFLYKLNLNDSKCC